MDQCRNKGRRRMDIIIIKRNTGPDKNERGYMVRKPIEGYGPNQSE